MTVRPRLAFVFFALLPVACRAQRPQIAVMPPEIRPTWDRCEAAVTRWCAERANGAPTEERDCVELTSRQYVGAADEAARTAHLRAHGCTL